MYKYLHKQFKTTIIKTLVYNAAYITSTEAFNSEIEKMHEVDPASIDSLLLHINLEHEVEILVPWLPLWSSYIEYYSIIK